MSSLTERKVSRVYFLLLVVFAFFNKTQSITAQSLPKAPSKFYTIGAIKITGTNTYSENTVIAYTGLKKGERIQIPGDRIRKIIKKLWDLKLFSDINFYIIKEENGIADIEIQIQEVPSLYKVQIDGVSKNQAEELIQENKLTEGAKITENLLTTTRNFISNKYKKEGFLNTKIRIKTTPSRDTTLSKQAMNMRIQIDKGEKIKINTISIEGNSEFSDQRIRRLLKKTKVQQLGRFWKRSKYVKSDFEEDKAHLISKYKEKGFRDARIVGDSIQVQDDKTITLHLKVEEGNRYYFGDITFLGNSVYTDRQLARQLVIKKGDVYNGVLLEKQIADKTRPDAEDLTNLYQNNGYLFSNIDPVETRVKNDTIDFEIRIREGKLVRFREITISGNDRTNDHVVYRILRTRPGEIYSKDAVVRTVREIGKLNFFDPEQLEPQFKNANPQDGTIDINYPLVEKGSSQIELQGGFGGGGFIGTLGLSFNNFSIKNIFRKEAWQPLPMGDGQTLRVRAQASQFFQTYSLTFIEPWLTGKRPFQLSTSFSHTIQYLFNSNTRSVDRNQKFLITGGSIGIARRLNWPDNYFTLSQTVNIRHYDLKNYNTGLFTFGNGSSNDLSYTIGLNRDNTRINPIFPTGGSAFNIIAKFSLPYSLFENTSYENLARQQKNLREEEANLTTSAVDEIRRSEIKTEIANIDQTRFKWLEYYKIKFDGSWYTSLFKIGQKPLVLRTRTEFGFLGAYDNNRGVIPFERFFLGGDGLGATSLDGREVIALRGYPNQSLIPEEELEVGEVNNSVADGATIYNKYSLEFRYPITLKPTASIYLLGFLEAGASFDDFATYNPFKLKRSSGLGIRIFMPAFGLLGIDVGYGFDPLLNNPRAKRLQTHFVIGQQF